MILNKLLLYTRNLRATVFPIVMRATSNKSSTARFTAAKKALVVN